MTEAADKIEERGREAFLKKHNQLDFFVANGIGAAPKGDCHSMEHPMFSLSKRNDIKIREYHHGDTCITITPSVKGLATIWDKDILLYFASQITEALNQGRQVGRKVKSDSYAILTGTDRSTGGKSYVQLIAALERLAGTQITTNLKTGGLRQAESFGLIDSWRVAETNPKTGRPISIELTLSEWLFRALCKREVLTFNREYFKLSGGLERRLYELVRKHCGYQPSWGPGDFPS
ncbi:MAG: replication initiator protein A [Candidatus Thiodiazotropha sp. (ex Ustalcina ferruginea)]|nr:replication initiator protein A [Candidatus Thiodiazotropha sp. (ex Ustalcina ferruginea)]